MLKKQYGIKAEKVSFIPVGEESFAYKAVANNGRVYFIKYCERREVIESLKTVNELLLQIQDLDFVIPPIVAHNRTSFELGKGWVYVFPFIEGGITERGNDTFEKDLVAKLTKMMVQIHKLKNRVKIALPVENFRNKFFADFEKLLSLESAKKYETDNEARLLLNSNENLIRQLISDHTKLGEYYKNNLPQMVLTHGDITGKNIILSKDGLKLVDWDGVMIAPFERDLNFLLDNPNFSVNEYLGKMKKDSYDPKLREYYGRQWALGSILGNLENLLTMGLTPEDRIEYIDEAKEYLRYYQ